MLFRSKKGETAHWLVCLKRSGKPIGLWGYTVTYPSNHRATIGGWIDAEHWGRGYATELSKAMIEYGFKHLKLNRIDGVLRVYNAASQRMLSKAGMSWIGTHRDYWLLKGQQSAYHKFAVMRAQVEAQLKGSKI